MKRKNTVGTTSKKSSTVAALAQARESVKTAKKRVKDAKAMLKAARVDLKAAKKLRKAAEANREAQIAKPRRRRIRAALKPVPAPPSGKRTPRAKAVADGALMAEVESGQAAAPEVDDVP